MSSIHYTLCPVCDSPDINPLLTVTDHSVSKESFVIWLCGNCSLRFTQDVPDESSIGRYYASEDYIFHTNTSKGLINQLYQKVRSFTLQEKASLIYNYTRKVGAVLDIGAGTGAFLSVMKMRGWQVTGIEPDEGARRIARASFQIELQPKERFYNLMPSSYDAITLWHVLEHVQELQDYVERLKGLLTPGGRIFIAVPNYTSFDAETYKLYWAAYDVPRHLYHFSPRSMEMLMNRHGLRIIEKKPMWFDSFYISFISSKYKNGRINWLAAAINGLRSNISTIFNKERCSSVIYVIAQA